MTKKVQNYTRRQHLYQKKIVFHFEGLNEGADVGLFEGEIDGATEGELDGFCVGLVEGIKVGAMLGFLVGAVVGPKHNKEKRKFHI